MRKYKEMLREDGGGEYKLQWDGDGHRRRRKARDLSQGQVIDPQYFMWY